MLPHLLQGTMNHRLLEMKGYVLMSIVQVKGYYQDLWGRRSQRGKNQEPTRVCP